MDRENTLRLLQNVGSGIISPELALAKLSAAPFEDLGYAKVDHHRALRQGAGEVIYGQGKTTEQIYGIVSALLDAGARGILVTRVSGDAALVLQGKFDTDYSEVARLAVVAPERERAPKGSVAVVSGGTSDLPVCEEAALTAEALGSRVTRIYDAGVAGLHRLLSRLDELTSARCVVAVAGMEGALASVVGGLVACPVIAVPTSIGYGANFSGLSALLSMLNSCASGVSVVNIDNGFGAGYLASMINKMEGIA